MNHIHSSVAILAQVLQSGSRASRLEAELVLSGCKFVLNVGCQRSTSEADELAVESVGLVEKRQ